MVNIISFQQYVNSKEEEKKRIKRITALYTKINNIEGLLHSITNSIGCSFVTKHLGEMNQVVGKESILDSDMLNIIVQSLNNYRDTLCGQVNELSNCSNTRDIKC